MGNQALLARRNFWRWDGYIHGNSREGDVERNQAVNAAALAKMKIVYCIKKQVGRFRKLFARIFFFRGRSFIIVQNKLHFCSSGNKPGLHQRGMQGEHENAGKEKAYCKVQQLVCFM